MQANSEYMTMDGEELELLAQYEKQFGEVPFVAFIDPRKSKRMIKKALRDNRPFNLKDIESEP